MLFIQVLTFIGLVCIIQFIFGLIRNARHSTKTLLTMKRKRVIFYTLGLLLFLFAWNYFDWPMSISDEAIASQIRINQSEDARKIFFRYMYFEEWMNSGQYELAYDYMAPAYRQRNSLEAFKDRFSQSYFPSLYPEPKLSISLNGSTAILSPDWNIYGTWDQSAVVLYMEKVGEEWYFTGEVNYILD